MEESLGGTSRGPAHPVGRLPVLAAVAVLLLIEAAGFGLVFTQLQANQRIELRQQQSAQQVAQRLLSLERRLGSQPDWTATAMMAERSIFTVATKTAIGSGWVVHSDAAGSDVITNLHVVAQARAAGDASVELRQGDRTAKGTITRVDVADDLVVIRVPERFAALDVSANRPQLGDSVMVVGSPLGLGGSISIGVVSGFRSLQGSDYVQFSAPISPGNSGGPLLDAHGRVLGVATAKYSGDGVEAIGLAIPVQVVCLMIPCPIR